MKYRHKQIGWVSMAALAMGLVLMLTVFISMTRLQIPMLSFMALFGLFALLFLVFCSLTTEIDGEEFSARFGVFGWPVRSMKRWGANRRLH